MNKHCFVTIRDTSSPFLKIVLTLLIFFMKDIVTRITSRDEDKE